MTPNPDNPDGSRKRTRTSYGDVEYDTIQCAECTNDTVTTEITHVYVIDDRPDAPEIENESIIVHPVCHDCIEEIYGGTAEYTDLNHDILCQYYTEQGESEDGAQLITVTPETIETSEPTAHGDVDVTVASCSRCEDECVVNDLRAVYIPTTIVNGKIYTGVRLYCPDCREIYVTAIKTVGPTFNDVVEVAGVLGTGDSDASLEEQVRFLRMIDAIETEGSDSSEKSLAKQVLATTAGGLLVSVIAAAIHPILGGLSLIFFGLIVVHLAHRHFAGLGPIEQ